MKPTLQFRLSQHLTLTPQLQQSIRLLQLSTVELNQEIERMLMENPILEREDIEGDAQAAFTPPRDAPQSAPEPGAASPVAQGSSGGSSGKRVRARRSRRSAIAAPEICREKGLGFT